MTGRTERGWLGEAIEEYRSRLKNYLFTDWIEIDVSSKFKADVNTLKQEEGKRILELLKPGDFLLVLDERGNLLDSRELSSFLSRRFLYHSGSIVFLIGGPFGFSQSVLDRADFKLSLSKLTFTHQMVRLILLEQLYRAMTIIKNESYHHD